MDPNKTERKRRRFFFFIRGFIVRIYRITEATTYSIRFIVGYSGNECVGSHQRTSVLRLRLRCLISA